MILKTLMSFFNLLTNKVQRTRASLQTLDRSICPEERLLAAPQGFHRDGYRLPKHAGGDSPAKPDYEDLQVHREVLRRKPLQPDPRRLPNVQDRTRQRVAVRSGQPLRHRDRIFFRNSVPHREAGRNGLLGA